MILFKSILDIKLLYLSSNLFLLIQNYLFSNKFVFSKFNMSYTFLFIKMKVAGKFTLIYIMQSTLPTTIYVQNLSFFVTEIWISHNFFSIGPIYRIFMRDREQVWNFWTPTKKRVKRVKRVKKGQNLIFCKKVKILKHDFSKSLPLCTPFTLLVLFCKK